MNYSNIKIKRDISKAGLLQKEIARRMGITPVYLSRVLRNEPISTEFEKRIYSAISGNVKNAKMRKCWISVKDRLPDKDGFYIVFDGESVFPAEYEHGRRVSEWTDDYEGYCDYDVTHWMPLPEPPKEDDGK